MSAAIKFKTIHDWLDLADDERCELIEGEFVYKAMPSNEHALFQAELASALSVLRKRRKDGPPNAGWWFMTEINVSYEGRPNGFIHDIAGWRKERHPERPVGKCMTLSPDWVCEILSPGNKKNDLITKRAVLYEHRVPYYWVVDTTEESIMVLKWEDKGYTVVADAQNGDKKSLPPFESLTLDIADLFGYEE